MNDSTTSPNAAQSQNIAESRDALRLVVHGSAVLIIALIAGLMLTFSMAGGWIVWPFLDIPADIIGSVRGWKAAHVGGLTNGIMLLVFAALIAKIPMTAKARSLSSWCFVLTGWGNTSFYWAGNLAANRGVSFHGNAYGETSLAGKIAFLSGGSVMLLTILGAFLVMSAGYACLKNQGRESVQAG